MEEGPCRHSNSCWELQGNLLTEQKEEAEEAEIFSPWCLACSALLCSLPLTAMIWKW